MNIDIQEKIKFYLDISPEKFLECLKIKDLNVIKFLFESIKKWDIYRFYIFSKCVSVGTLEAIKYFYYHQNFIVTKSVLRIALTRNDRDIIIFLTQVSEGKCIPEDFLYRKF